MNFGLIRASSANRSDDNIGAFCALAAIGIFVSIAVWSYWRRRRALRQFSESNSWAWIGSDIPWDVPFRELLGEPNRDVEIENAFSGIQKDLSFVACDCIFGSGRSKFRASLVAVKSHKNPFGAEKWTSELSVTQSGEWFGAIRPRKSFALSGYRTFSVAEVIAIVESIG